MDLPEALRTQKNNFLKSAPEDVVSVMSDALDNLTNSGILTKCNKTGDQISDFTLPDVNDTFINLFTRLKNGPVVLKFFRGDW